MLTYDGDRFIWRGGYETRHTPKEARFRWDPARKEWWTGDAEKACTLLRYADARAKAKLDGVQAKVIESIESSRAAAPILNKDIPVPAGRAYLPYQLAGIQFACDRPSTLIADEMGLGKTIQAIGVINADPSIKRVLVVCPASLRLNWQREMERWLVECRAIGIAQGSKWPTGEPDIVIINYDVLGKHAERLYEREWDLLVADEAHYLKNPKTQRTTGVLGKWAKDEAKRKPAIRARRRLFLAGTPICNRPIELHPLLASINPREWGNWRRYAERYCAAYQDQWGWNVTGSSNLEELQRKLRSTVMVRRVKKDVLKELPPKRRQVVELPTNGAGADVVANEAAAWAAQEASLEALIAAVELAKASAEESVYDEAVQRLREGASHAFTEISRIRHETALAKVPAALEFIADASESGDKLVVFGHHKDVLAEVVEGLRERKVSVVMVTGDTSMTERQAAVDAFQSDADVRVIIGTVGAMGVGLTLTASAHVIFMELDWVPGNITQAEDRCHRIGAEVHESILIQHLVFDGSIDARMAHTLVEKQAVIDAALDVDRGEPALPAAEPATRSVTRKQIDEQAATMTVDQAEVIHLCLRMLSGMCDGARALDGAGFNKLDTNIGKSLAGQIAGLTKRQAVLGLRLVRKYRRQLPRELVDRANAAERGIE